MVYQTNLSFLRHSFLSQFRRDRPGQEDYDCDEDAASGGRRDWFVKGNSAENPWDFSQEIYKLSFFKFSKPIHWNISRCPFSKFRNNKSVETWGDVFLFWPNMGHFFEFFGFKLLQSPTVTILRHIDQFCGLRRYWNGQLQFRWWFVYVSVLIIWWAPKG